MNKYLDKIRKWFKKPIKIVGKPIEIIEPVVVKKSTKKWNRKLGTSKQEQGIKTKKQK